MNKIFLTRLYTTFSKFNLEPIKVTDNAWNKIGNILKIQSNNWGFLFSAEGGGCGGFNYSFKTINNEKYNKILNKSKIKPSIIHNNNNGNNSNKIMIDPYSEMFLLGTTIDYVIEDYNKNIFENKFIFIPNKDLATTCGCGISFSPK